MSTSFEVFPTKRYIPTCDEVVGMAIALFREFLKREKIILDLQIRAYEISEDKNKLKSQEDKGNQINKDKQEILLQENPIRLISREDGYNTFSLNEIGNIFVYYHKNQEITKEFWLEEMTNNKKAFAMKESIEHSLDIGYSWSIVRTVGQPVLVSLFYGYLAIALAKLTEGIIFSDDGAWEYSCFPIRAEDFEKIYLDVASIIDKSQKEVVENWISMLSKGE